MGDGSLSHNFVIALTRTVPHQKGENRPHTTKRMYSKRAFTLVEIIIAFTIFVVIMGLVFMVVVMSYRSFNQGERMAERQQSKRTAFFWLSKELSSLTRITYPGSYFKGEEKSFFLSTTRKII